jgi:hypothetical protein
VLGSRLGIVNPTPSPVFTHASPNVAAMAAIARLPGSPLQPACEQGGHHTVLRERAANLFDGGQPLDYQEPVLSASARPCAVSGARQ